MDMYLLMEAAKGDAVQSKQFMGRSVFPCNGRKFVVTYRRCKSARKDHYTFTVDGSYKTEDHFAADLDRALRMECQRSRMAREHINNQAKALRNRLDANH